MIVSRRLSAIVDTISTDSLCDIGTDHGYIPIEAMNKGKVNFALACDVNKEPLAIGEKNIKSAGYENKIKTTLSNGLSNVEKNSATSCSICGMGGLLVIDILKNNEDVAKSFEQLILQPQSEINKVREFVFSLGFFIKEERYILDSEKFYVILNCYKGEGKKYSIKELMCGSNIYEEDKETYLKYIKVEYDKCNKVLKSLKNIENCHEKKDLFLKKASWYKELLTFEYN